LKVTVYKCNLCEQSWEADFVFGVDVVPDGTTGLLDPEDSDKHICRNCIIAIKGSLIEKEE
jgi:hypothetical protein